MIAAAGAATCFAGMVVTPLARRAGATRRVSAAFVVGGLAVTTFDRVRSRWGPSRAGASFAIVTALGWLVETVGTRSGRPFGRYSYSGMLRPTLGGVPVIVPLAWFAMAVPARETAHAALGHRSSRTGRIVGGAAALTAWDLFLDPQMAAEGYWRWSKPGRYRGIPATNFVGWFVTAVAVMSALELTAPPEAEPDTALVAEYSGVAAMQTLGFAAFFRDRTVAAVGGAAMLPIATIAVARAARLFRCG